MSSKMNADKGQVNRVGGGPLCLAGGDDKGYLIETLAANRTLKVYESQVQFFDPNGSNYLVFLPKISTPHHRERRGLVNIAQHNGSSGTLNYRNAGNTATAVTLQPGEAAIMVSNGVTWSSVLIPTSLLGGAPVSNANQAALVDNTAGNTSAVTLETVGNTAAGDESGIINNNFARLDKLLEAIRAAAITKGIIQGS